MADLVLVQAALLAVAAVLAYVGLTGRPAPVGKTSTGADASEPRATTPTYEETLDRVARELWAADRSALLELGLGVTVVWGEADGRRWPYAQVDWLGGRKAPPAETAEQKGGES